MVEVGYLVLDVVSSVHCICIFVYSDDHVHFRMCRSSSISYLKTLYPASYVISLGVHRFHHTIHAPIATFVRIPNPYVLTFLPPKSGRALLIIRPHNLITPSSIPKLTPFTLLPPIRFLKGSSMRPRFVSVRQLLYI